MTKTAFLLTLIITALSSLPAQAQPVFVSGHGLDTNPCTVTEPCRTFQQAHDTAAANGEIDVLDPAGYGPLNITKGISVQAHGFGGISQAAGAAITIAVTPGDPVTLNGLLLDGAGTGQYGILITSGSSVQILNTVARRFQYGIVDQTSTNGSNLLIKDTIVSDNLGPGIAVVPSGSNTKATLNRITTNNNSNGVVTAGTNTTIANSVMSNNSAYGLNNLNDTTWLAKNVISGNSTGVNVAGGTVISYGDNYINDNGTPVNGSLTPVSMQ